jgi:DNA-binding transcriptional MocR family regulator
VTELPIIQTNVPPGVIDLGMGNPDFNLLPIELLHHSAEEYFKIGDPRHLQYGLEQGDGYFRGALADFLTKAYGRSVNPELLFVTAGASSALDLLCSLYSQPGDVIFVEEPSYFLALRIFRDHGLNAIPIPMDEDGIRLDLLEEQLTAKRPKFIYIIPAFQNPSGRTLTQERREKLVALAQEHNFLVLADEAYQFLPYTQSPPNSFAGYTEDVEQIISVNSFSKILAPGLRMGWIQAHSAVIKRLASSGMLESGGGMNPYTSALVRGLIESGGLGVNINKLRNEYASRLEAMHVALSNHLPQAEYTLPEGGFFFWIHLPGENTTELRKIAQESKVDFRQGVLFSSQQGLQEYMRLGYCFYRPKAIEEGIKRLSDCLGY